MFLIWSPFSKAAFHFLENESSMAEIEIIYVFSVCACLSVHMITQKTFFSHKNQPLHRFITLGM